MLVPNFALYNENKQIPNYFNEDLRDTITPQNNDSKYCTTDLVYMNLRAYFKEIYNMIIVMIILSLITVLNKYT